MFRYIYFMDVFVGYTVIVTIYMTYDRLIQVGFPGNDCNMHDM